MLMQVHLGNIMVGRKDSADDTAATCVLLDFGRSRFNATPDEQRQEAKTLQRLLRA